MHNHQHGGNKKEMSGEDHEKPESSFSVCMQAKSYGEVNGEVVGRVEYARLGHCYATKCWSVFPLHCIDEPGAFGCKDDGGGAL
jgi:hypothetical protein